MAYGAPMGRLATLKGETLWMTTLSRGLAYQDFRSQCLAALPQASHQVGAWDGKGQTLAGAGPTIRLCPGGRAW